MEERKEPRYAAGQELTLHNGDPVKGAELLEDHAGAEHVVQQETPAEDHWSPPEQISFPIRLTPE